MFKKLAAQLWNKLHAITFQTSSIVWVCMGVLLLAYGLFVPVLGFYMDDWHHIYFDSQRGLDGLRELFLYDSRPFAYVFYFPIFRVLGYSPQAWQLLSIFLRGLVAWSIWVSLRSLWRNADRQIFWVTLFFLVYPIFRLNFISLAYAMHWFGYALYVLSIWAMLKTIQCPAQARKFMLLGLFLGASHLFLLEYFVGLELARPLFLGLSLAGEAPLRTRFKKIVQIWLPYAFFLVGFVVYRLAWLPKPYVGYERNALVLLQELQQAPLQAAWQFAQVALQDIFEILIATWGRLLTPNFLAFTEVFRFFTLLMIVFAAASLYFYLRRVIFASAVNSVGWSYQALFLGFVLTILGILPIWATGQYITTDNPLWSNRYALASILGASLVIVALLEIFIASERKRALVTSVLLALSIGWNIQNANEFRWSWTKQSDFYRQLVWRVPYLEPGTAFLAEGEIFSQMTEIETSFAIGALYPRQDDDFPLNYFFFSLSRRFSDRMDELLQGIPLRYNSFYTIFRKGNSANSLVVSFEPEQNQCLWVLKPEDQNANFLPPLTAQAVILSNLSLIQPNFSGARPLPENIIGAQHTQTWCYFYQKAALAQQQADWATVMQLWNDAQKNAVHPKHGYELLPFIEGYARRGDWQVALKLTQQSKQLTRAMTPRLCALWQILQTETPSTPERTRTLQELGCTP